MVRPTKKGIAHAAPQKASLRTLHAPGEVEPVPFRAAMKLARAIHHSESQKVAISWSAQERAEAFFNEHGLSATLTEATRLETLAITDNGAT